MNVVYDKLSFTRRLEGEHLFSRSQAEALAEAMHDALSETVCTKADLSAARADLMQEVASTRADLGQVRSELMQEVASTRRDLSQVRSDLTHEIALLRSELKLWTGSMTAALFAGLFTSLGGLMAIFKFLVH